MGQRRSLAENRPFPGNSRWCSTWLNSREASGVDPKLGAVCSREDSRRYAVLSYTSGAAGGGGVIDIRTLSIPGQLDVLFIPGQIDVLFIPGGGVSFTHTSVRGAASV